MARILIVDDDETNRKLLRVILQNKGHETLEAEDGLQALDILKGQIPDLILMDIRRPVMDGIEATKRLKKDPILSKIPVVVLTASATKEERERIETLSIFDDYIIKPIDVDDFINKVESILRRKGNG